MTSKLLLFKLPQLVIGEILSCMDHYDVIMLARCSRTTKRVMKWCKNFKLDISVRFEEHQYCKLILFDKDKNRRISNLTFNSDLILKGQYFTKYEKLECVTLCIAHIAEVFTSKNRIDSLEIYNCNENISDIVSLMSRFQHDIPNLILQVKCIKNNDLSFILNTCQVAEMLSLRIQQAFDFEPSRDINSRLVHIEPAYWVRIEHVLSMNCEFLGIQHSWLKDRDLNCIVKQWVAKESLINLKTIGVTARNLHLSGIMDSIERVEINREEVINLNRLPNKITMDIRGGYLITRNDGVKAIIPIFDSSHRLLGNFMPFWISVL